MRTSYADCLAAEQAPSIIPVLKLRRGGSPIAQWAMGADDVGKFVTVGRDASCDWPISSPGVALRELSFRFDGDALFVRSERPEPGPRMNGRRLDQDWQEVPRGARLDCGTACIEVQSYDVTSQVEPAERDDSDSGVRKRPEPPSAPKHTLHEIHAEPVAPRPPVALHVAPVGFSPDAVRDMDEPTIVIDPVVFHDALMEAPAPRPQRAARREPTPQAVLMRHAWEGEPSDDDLPVALLPDTKSTPGLRYAWIPAIMMVGWAFWLTFTEL